MSKVIETLERAQLRDDIPRFKAGDTVRVHFKVIEGQRHRIQVFEGIVLKRQGAGARESFTVRKQSFGVGVERTFPLHSPKIEKIEVAAIGDVNRAKLYYLRGKVGRKARVRELRQDGSRGARLVAGTDEAGRGSLAGPLVVAGVLLDYGCLRDHKVRPLGLLNDSKQCSPERREELFHAVLGCAEQVVVRVIPHGQIDRNGLHRSNLAAMREILRALSPPAEACLVDGFRLGPTAPEHRAVVDGDEKSAAIAAASIVAKVTRDRLMRRMDALYPNYGFSSHVGYITPGHSAIVRRLGPSRIHRRSFQALCYLSHAEAESAAARHLEGASDGGMGRAHPTSMTASQDDAAAEDELAAMSA